MIYPHVFRVYIQDENAARGDLFMRLRSAGVQVKYGHDRISLETPNCLIRFVYSDNPMETATYMPATLAARICKIEKDASEYEPSKNPDPKDLIKDVVFNPPATIVLWNDGTKTVVKTQGADLFDKTAGLAMAICKKHFGNDSYFNEIFRKYVPDYDPPKTTYVKEPMEGSDIIGPFDLSGALQGCYEAMGKLKTALSGDNRVETCRERLKKEHPANVNIACIGGCSGCPSTYGYAPKPAYCLLGKEDDMLKVRAACEKCWDRPVEEKPEHKDYDKLAAESSHPFLKKNFTLPKLEKAEIFGPPLSMKEIERALDAALKFPLIEFSQNDSRTFNRSVLMNFGFPKYEFTGETKMVNGRTVRRIRAARNIYLPAPNEKQEPILFVKKGDLGGWIEKEENLSQVGTCWVGENAVVMDDAKVLEGAYAYGRALVCDNAHVMGDAIVCDHAKILGNAVIGDDAYIHDYAWVGERAKVLHNANVGGRAVISDSVTISRDCTITGNVMFGGSFTYEGVTRE